MRAKLGEAVQGVLTQGLWEGAAVAWANHATFRTKQQAVGWETLASLDWVEMKGRGPL